MPLQPRTRGAGSIAVRAGAQGETRLANLRQSGAMKLVLPRVFRPDIEAVIVNTAGGVTGGDRLKKKRRKIWKKKEGQKRVIGE